jgi:hypothetical protein
MMMLLEAREVEEGWTTRRFPFSRDHDDGFWIKKSCSQTFSLLLGALFATSSIFLPERRR